MARDLPIGPGLAGLEAAVEGHPGLPPVERWNPPYCGDSHMRIASDGTWFHEGQIMGRPAMVRLFSTVLRKDDEGFMLVTPVEKLSIAVDDAPFIAVLMDADGHGPDMRLTFTTNMGDKVTAGPGHALRFAPDAKTGAPIPYLHVRKGLEAKLARPVYYALMELAITQEGALGVWSDGVYFSLGNAP
jgi:uncharacterized protein